MQFIDTHTHLFSSQFENDIQKVVEDSISSCVTKFFIPHIDSESTEAFYKLCHAFPNIMYPLMGVHPSSINQDYVKELNHVFNQFEKVKELIPQQKFFGVGEIGIDLYWDKTYLKQQQDAFEQQLLFAKDRKLPIIIHARESFNEIFEIVDKHIDENLSGVFHCFTGNLEQANHIINYKTFKMGIGGVLTFKKSGLDKVVEQIDLSHLVLETDSPYLAPTPYRGKRNMSSYIPIIAQKLAEIKGISLEQIAEITTKNAIDIFKLNEN